MSKKKKAAKVTLVRNLIIGAVALVVALVVGYGLLYTTGITEGEFVAGEHYRVVEDAPRKHPGSPVEVQEFFSYGCIYCRNFEPLITEWRKNLPEGVRFERVPVAFSPQWMLLAQAYYTLEVLDILEENHNRIFARIHDRRDMFDSAEDLSEFIDGHGASAEEFLAAFNGPEVRRRLRYAANAEREVVIASVPTLVVNGRYVITMDVGRKVALEVTDHLIAMEQAGADAADGSADPVDDSG